MKYMSIQYHYQMVDDAAYLELIHAHELVYTNLDHIEHSTIKHSHERHSIRPFLRALPNHKHTSIVLL